MFEIEIDKTFSAAHRLRGYCGPCSNLHGHNYEVTVTVQAEELNELGLSLDFKRLKTALDQVLESYDHHDLSQLPEFQALNPSSEVLAQTIYRRMQAELASEPVRVVRVKLGESASSRVIYFE